MTANKIFLAGISVDLKNKILKDMTHNYGITTERAYNELIDEDAENVYEYIRESKLKSFVFSMFNQMLKKTKK